MKQTDLATRAEWLEAEACRWRERALAAEKTRELTPLDIAEMERGLLEYMDEDEAMSALQVLRPWLSHLER